MSFANVLVDISIFVPELQSILYNLSPPLAATLLHLDFA